MDATSVYPSQWLKASDIGDKPLKSAISNVKMVTVSETEQKIELTFKDNSKTLLLNKTNATRLIEAFGKETDKWIGKNVELYTTQVSFRGEEVPAIRLRIAK